MRFFIPSAATHLLISISLFVTMPLEAAKTRKELRLHADRLVCAELLTEQIASQALFLKMFSANVEQALADGHDLSFAQILGVRGMPLVVWPRFVRAAVIQEQQIIPKIEDEIEDPMDVVTLQTPEGRAWYLVKTFLDRGSDILPWPDHQGTEVRAERCWNSAQVPEEYRNLIQSQLKFHRGTKLPYTPMFDYFLKNLLKNYLGEIRAFSDRS